MIKCGPREDLCPLGKFIMAFINGFGVINGLAFIASGGLGVFSAKKPSRCTIKALMALTIISACLTVPRLVFDVLGAVSLDVTVKTEKLDDSLSKSLDAVSARYE